MVDRQGRAVVLARGGVLRQLRSRPETGQPDGRKLDSSGVESPSLSNSCLSRVKFIILAFHQGVELIILLLDRGSYGIKIQDLKPRLRLFFLALVPPAGRIFVRKAPPPHIIVCDGNGMAILEFTGNLGGPRGRLARLGVRFAGGAAGLYRCVCACPRQGRELGWELSALWVC